jgi:hypothetical protein
MPGRHFKVKARLKLTDIGGMRESRRRRQVILGVIVVLWGGAITVRELLSGNGFFLFGILMVVVGAFAIAKNRSTSES